jgi:hypothetical protein
VFGTRAEAVANPIVTTGRLAYAENVYGGPGDPHSQILLDDPATTPDFSGLVLALSNLQVPDVWGGCVWGYVAPAATHIIDGVTAELQARTGDDQALDGVAAVAHEPVASVGPMPSVGVHVESFEQVLATEVSSPVQRWRGRFGVAVRVEVPQLGAWWRTCLQYVTAVRSILADECSRSMRGVVAVWYAGGEQLRDGVGVLRFYVDVVGQYEL